MLGDRPTDQSITHLIRSAERYISQQKFELARNQLDVARQLAPRNSYIGAIIERLSELETVVSRPTMLTLSPTIDPKSVAGFLTTERPSETHEVQTRVRQLTSAAEKALEEGSVENAFNSLMKAYLLDPVSPFVLSCEKTLLPVWESAHPSNPSYAAEEESMTSRELSQNRFTDQLSPSGGTSLDPEQAQRLEVLKRQKEAERAERERARWREASRPPTVVSPAAEPHGPPADQEREDVRSLFTKMKLGKFLTP